MRLSLLSGLIGLVALARCTPNREADSFVLNIALPSPISAPNGRDIDGYATVVDDWIYESLVRMSEDGSLTPQLATALDKRADGRIRLHLRSDATFSDGSPVTRQDLVASFASTGLKIDFPSDELIVSSEIPGVSVSWLLPTVTVRKQTPAGNIGTGPYQIVEQDSTHLLLRRRVPSAGRINTVRLTSYDGPREALARVLRGDANLLAQVEPREVEFFEGVSRLQVLHASSLHIVAIAMNSRRLSSAERIGIAHALPAAELTNTVFGSACKPWPTELARRNLPDGRALDVVSADWDASLAKLGLAARRSLGVRGGELRHLNAESVQKALFNDDYDLTPIELLVQPIGAAALRLHTGSPRNITHYSNAEVDAALEKEDWPATLAALDKDPPFAFICTRERILIVDARIKNPKLGYALLESLPDWEVGE